MHPLAAALLGEHCLNFLALHGRGGFLLALALAKPIFLFFKLAFNPAPFERAFRDRDSVLRRRNFLRWSVGQFGMFAPPLVGNRLQRLLLNRHRTRNLWQPIALEPLDLVGGHPPLATRSGFRGNDAVLAQATDLGRTDAKLPRDLAR
ncbi:MAG TPA: hypothetical protein VME17_14665 [Bryobacteraceae bacterium]|nr:hypothetical protein [Bryobacteraceae bacterium]